MKAKEEIKLIGFGLKYFIFFIQMIQPCLWAAAQLLRPQTLKRSYNKTVYTQQWEQLTDPGQMTLQVTQVKIIFRRLSSDQHTAEYQIQVDLPIYVSTTYER